VSPELYDFLKDWLFWAENGATPLRPYSRTTGLCYNIERYPQVSINSSFSCDRVFAELEDLFEIQKFSRPCYPFGFVSFHAAARSATMHLDPQRLAWVRNKIEEYEADCQSGASSEG